MRTPMPGFLIYADCAWHLALPLGAAPYPRLSPVSCSWASPYVGNFDGNKWLLNFFARSCWQHALALMRVRSAAAWHCAQTSTTCIAF
jgi:hypothetical protein